MDYCIRMPNRSINIKGDGPQADPAVRLRVICVVLIAPCGNGLTRQVIKSRRSKAGTEPLYSTGHRTTVLLWLSLFLDQETKI
jgi:hypothetical protein